jgi:hypothetical protein
MSISIVGELARGHYHDSTVDPTFLDIATTREVPVGNTVIVVVSAAGNIGASSIAVGTDTADLDKSYAIGVQLQVAIFSRYAFLAIPAGATIRFTVPGGLPITTGAAVIAFEAEGLFSKQSQGHAGNGAEIDLTAQAVIGADPATHLLPTITSGTTAQADELLVSALWLRPFQPPASPVQDTENTTVTPDGVNDWLGQEDYYSADKFPTGSSGAEDDSAGLLTATKVLSAIGTATFSATLSQRLDWFFILVAYKGEEAAAEGDGVDLVQAATGWVFRSFRATAAGTIVRVERTLDAGVTWEGGAVAADAAPDAVPTLAITRWDELLLFYHTTDRELRRWLSEDLGETWSDAGTLSDLQYEYPRVVVLDSNTCVMVMWSSNLGGLRLFTSADYGATWTGVKSIASIDRQLASLRLDRFGYLHLLYEVTAGDAIRHQLSEDDGETWSAAVQYGTATGDAPVMAPGPSYRGLLAVFEGLTLYVWSTEPGFAEPKSRTLHSTPYAAPQWMGTLVDAEDVLWLCGRLDGSNDLQVMQSFGTAFAAPV